MSVRNMGHKTLTTSDKMLEGAIKAANIVKRELRTSATGPK